MEDHRPTVWLGGPMDAYDDLGYAWRKRLAVKLYSHAKAVWPVGLAESECDVDALAALRREYAEEPLRVIRADLELMLSCDLLIFRLDGREGVGTQAEMAVARWARKPCVIWAWDPRVKLSTHAVLPDGPTVVTDDEVTVAERVLRCLSEKLKSEMIS